MREVTELTEYRETKQVEGDTPTFDSVVKDQKFAPIETCRPKWSPYEAAERLGFSIEKSLVDLDEEE